MDYPQFVAVAKQTTPIHLVRSLYGSAHGSCERGTGTTGGGSGTDQIRKRYADIPKTDLQTLLSNDARPPKDKDLDRQEKVP